MDLSLYFPHSPRSIGQFVTFVRRAERLGVDRVWLGHSLSFSPETLIGAAVASGAKVGFGLAVQLISLTQPVAAGLGYAALRASGVDVQVAFGAGSPIDRAFAFPRGLASPLRATEEFITVVRAAAAGEELEQEGRYFSARLTRGALHPTPDLPVGLGVLGPRMAELAARRADFGVTWMTPAQHIAELLAPAATASGGTRWRSLVPVVVDDGLEDAEVEVIIKATCGVHASLPHYRAALRRSGVLGAEDTDDVEVSPRRLVEGGVVARGSAEQVAEEIRAYGEVGVEEVVLNPSGVLFTRGDRAFWTQVAQVARATGRL